MTVADYKKKWVETQLEELRASGLKDAAIARRMGISQAWYSEALSKPTVGDAFVNRLSKAFNLKFVQGNDLGDSLMSDPSETAGLDQPASATVKMLTETLNRAMQLLHEERTERVRLEKELRELRAEGSPRDGGRSKKAR